MKNTLPDNQNHVSQANVALFSAGYQLLSGLEMCFPWASSTSWKDDSHPPPLPVPLQGLIGFKVNLGQSDHFVCVSFTHTHQRFQM